MKKKNKLTIAAGSLALIILFGFAFGEFQNEPKEQVLRHMVLLDLNDQATDSVVEMMNQDLQELKENIEQIRELEFGTNIQENADYSHSLFLTFESVEDLRKYEDHPMHLEFASTYGKYVTKKTEVDYWY